MLVQAAWRERLESNLAPVDASRAPSMQYRAGLPELAWSVLEKPGVKERNALIRLLPGLVEHAPAFERAIESLLIGAEAIEQGRTS